MSDFKDLAINQEDDAKNRMVDVAENRAQHEVQAAYVIAKKFQRNELNSYNRIMNACKRLSMAESSMYSYPRGGTLVTGPSIRLAEMLAQNWGNIDAGVREVSQDKGVSIAEAYAIDLETNTRVTKTFYVKHERHTKQGVKRLTDPRDIYELVANQGARRLRACILGVIPDDVVEDAVNQCTKTLESSDVPIKEQVKKMVSAFDDLGVKVEHLEKRLGHNLDATIPSEIVTLKQIYRSLKDGMASREQFFDMGNQAEASKSVTSTLENLKNQKAKTVDKETGEIKEENKDGSTDNNKSTT